MTKYHLSIEEKAKVAYSVWADYVFDLALRPKWSELSSVAREAWRIVVAHLDAIAKEERGE